MLCIFLEGGQVGRYALIHVTLQLDSKTCSCSSLSEWPSPAQKQAIRRCLYVRLAAGIQREMKLDLEEGELEEVTD